MKFKSIKSTCPLPLVAAAVAINLASTPMRAADTDGRMESSATNAGGFRTGLAAKAITTESENLVVTLTGKANEAVHQPLVQDPVAGLAGVKRVADQLAVTGEVPGGHPDAWITMTPTAEVRFHQDASKPGAVVATNAGEKDHITKFAAAGIGVVSVTNNLTPAEGAGHGSPLPPPQNLRITSR